MKVLVTGGAGYIGSHTVLALQEAGHEVRVLDNLFRGHAAALPAGVELVEAGVGDAEACDRALKGTEAVLHFAGLLSVAESVREPAWYHRVNVTESQVLLEAMERAGVKRLVFSSTCATYGVPVHVPIDETHPQKPISPYGASKLAFEGLLGERAQGGRLRSIALRYFNAAGCDAQGRLGEDHHPEEHIVPLAVDAALGRGPGLTIFGDDYDTPDGTCVRDFIHVADLARAHVLALAAVERGEPFQAYNLGSEAGYSVHEVVKAVERVSGRTVPVSVGPRRPGDPPRLVAAAARAHEALGFKAALGLDAIVEHTLRWRESHPRGYADRAASA
jgi:UDP-glucose-4-epimerase GalE